MPFIQYNFRNKEARPEGERLPPFSLADAVSLYAPALDLSLIIGQYEIELEVKRDMYGLHSELLGLLEKLAYDLPGNPKWEPYVAAVDETRSMARLHLIVLTAFWAPPVIYFHASGDTVYLQTRTLEGQEVIATPEDVTNPVPCLRKELVSNIHAFLTDYLDGLARTFPNIRSLDDFQSYAVTLQKIAAAI